MRESGTSMRCSRKIANAGLSWASSSSVACAIVPTPRSEVLSGRPVTTLPRNHAEAVVAAHKHTVSITMAATKSRWWARIAEPMAGKSDAGTLTRSLVLTTSAVATDVPVETAHSAVPGGQKPPKTGMAVTPCVSKLQRPCPRGHIPEAGRPRPDTRSKGPDGEYG